MKFIVAVVVSAAALVLVGCAASSSVVVGTVGPPTAVDKVKIYSQPPKKFREIAIVESTNMGSTAITAQGRTDVVIERMKTEAARLGANGILLQGIGDRSIGAMSAGSTVGNVTAIPTTGNRIATGSTYSSGVGSSFGIMQKVGNGVAIFVEEE